MRLVINISVLLLGIGILLSCTVNEPPINPGSNGGDAPASGLTSPKDLDFSRVGYHFGESDFPEYKQNVIYISPRGNMEDPENDVKTDMTAEINNALKSVVQPGTVVLRAGRYYVSGQIKLDRSNVILKGETSASGDDPKSINMTTVISTRRDSKKASLLAFGNTESSPVRSITGTIITDEHISEGSICVTVDESRDFAEGDRVIIRRPQSEAWIRDLGMDAIIGKDGNTYSWTDYKSSMDIEIERIVTKRVGKVLYFDNPLPMSIDSKYGGGMVSHCTFTSPRVTESGVENINFDTVYDETVYSTQNGGSSVPLDKYHSDENHCWNAIRVFGAEHCWIKGITASHFSFSAVSIYGYSKNITVEDCHSYEPVSVINGSRRYAFAIGPAQLCLFKGCTADKDRHQFVTTGVTSIGPHVFVDCIATNSYSNAGPHSKWATCVLYDCLKTDALLSVEDAYYLGYSTGAQGWQGANHVFWNCEAATIVCQSPQVSARNWAWGCIGQKLCGSLANTENYGDRPDGQWFSAGVPVEPESLYKWQLGERLKEGDSLLHLIN